jgi:uncharacterized membrane protein
MRLSAMDRLSRTGFHGGMTSSDDSLGTGSPVLTALTVIAVIGAAAMGGVFFTFSGFVLAGLKRLPPAQGIAAMQSINVTAVRPPLMTLLFGTALVVVAVVALGLRAGNSRTTALLAVAAVLYLDGAVGVTAGYNVPLNDELAALHADAPEAIARWGSWVSAWSAGNTVRAVLCLLSAAGFTLALRH